MRPRPMPPARDGPARRPAARRRPRAWMGAAAACGGCAGMFHVKHTHNGLKFSNLQSQQNDVGYCTLPNLPQQYFAGVQATRLQM